MKLNQINEIKIYYKNIFSRLFPNDEITIKAFVDFNNLQSKLNYLANEYCIKLEVWISGLNYPVFKSTIYYKKDGTEYDVEKSV